MADTRDIYEDLFHRLVSNGFEHGQKLKSEHLRTEYGCSASTLREALFRLSNIGLVEFQEQRGFRVPLRSKPVIIELTHMRVLLEGEGAVLSIRRGGVAWEAKVTAAHHQLSHIEKRIHASTDTVPLEGLWFEAERSFHETLISACGSETLKAMHAIIYGRFRQQLMVEDRSFGYISNNIRDHQQIVEAALSGNEDLTHQKIHDHLARHLTGETLGI